jgi:anti-sigma28 factor (negative regulator of flagellin synthesis)
MKKRNKTVIKKIESRHSTVHRTKTAHAKKIKVKKQGNAMIKNTAGRTSDMRENKIALLKNAIETGTYVVHSNEIADKLIKESLLLLYLQRRMKTYH